MPSKMPTSMLLCFCFSYTPFHLQNNGKKTPSNLQRKLPKHSSPTYLHCRISLKHDFVEDFLADRYSNLQPLAVWLCHKQNKQ